MFFLYIHSWDAQQQRQHFQCGLYQLEQALELLNSIVIAGNVLEQVYIIEDGQRTNLSAKAFDGEDLIQPLQALQTQWEAVLSQPAEQPQSFKNRAPLEMMLDRIDRLETMMAEYEGMIARLEKLMLQTEQLNEGPHKERLLAHYHTIVTRHYQSMWRAQTDRNKCLQRLTRLKQVYLE